MGTSTMQLAKMLPEARVVGIELEDYLLDVARKQRPFTLWKTSHCSKR
jgi:hypothetical protein